MAPSPFLQAVRRADILQVPIADLVSNVLQSPSDQTGPTSLRPWSIPLHLARVDMQAGLTPIGWLRPAVRAFLEYHWPEGDLGEPMIEFGICRELAKEGTVGNCHQDGPEFAFIAQRLLDQGYEGLTREMNRLARYMKDKGMYSECLDGQSGNHCLLTCTAKRHLRLRHYIYTAATQAGETNTTRSLPAQNPATLRLAAPAYLLQEPRTR